MRRATTRGRWTVLRRKGSPSFNVRRAMKIADRLSPESLRRVLASLEHEMEAKVLAAVPCARKEAAHA